MTRGEAVSTALDLTAALDAVSSYRSVGNSALTNSA